MLDFRRHPITNYVIECSSNTNLATMATHVTITPPLRITSKYKGREASSVVSRCRAADQRACRPR